MCFYFSQLPLLIFFIFFFFWSHWVAYGILVPPPGIKPAPLALDALNHWTAREIPLFLILWYYFFKCNFEVPYMYIYTICCSFFQLLQVLYSSMSLSYNFSYCHHHYHQLFTTVTNNHMVKVYWMLTLEEGMATYSSILIWRIPWTEEAGGLQSTGSQRVGHSWATNAHTPLVPGLLKYCRILPHLLLTTALGNWWLLYIPLYRHKNRGIERPREIDQGCSASKWQRISTKAISFRALILNHCTVSYDFTLNTIQIVLQSSSSFILLQYKWFWVL